MAEARGRTALTPRNAKEPKKPKKAPFLVGKRIRERILDEFCKSGDRLGEDRTSGEIRSQSLTPKLGWTLAVMIFPLPFTLQLASYTSIRCNGFSRSGFEVNPLRRVRDWGRS
jgi:hypothetical protein